ncbi:hypothetical protein ABZ372_26255 [Streptomyces sp. NPDC005921]
MPGTVKSEATVPWTVIPSAPTAVSRRIQAAMTRPRRRTASSAYV